MVLAFDKQGVFWEQRWTTRQVNLETALIKIADSDWIDEKTGKIRRMLSQNMDSKKKTNAYVERSNENTNFKSIWD